MTDAFAGIATALWLGILTSISPCPLATNIAAISYIGRRVKNPRLVVASGLLYTCGRAVTYLCLGVLLVTSLLSAPYLSHALQKYMNKILGPLLIVVGMFLLDLVPFTFSGPAISDAMRQRVDRLGLGGAGVLGILFALSFCPVSAALFFGSLVPIAVKSESSVMLPSVYGIGTALPVVLVSFALALSVGSVGALFNRITSIETVARRITGVIFIGVGIYFSLTYIFRLFE